MPGKQRSLLPQMCLAFFLASGFALIYGMAVGWVNDMRKHVWFSPPARPVEGLFFTADGQAFITRSEGGPPTHWTLDRQPVPTLPPGAAMTSYPVSAGGARANFRGWEGRVIGFSDGATPPIYWYLFYDDDSESGRGYFVGFDPGSRRIVGYLGEQGFSMTAPGPQDQFSLDGSGYGQVATLPDVHSYLRGRTPPGRRDGVTDVQPPSRIFLKSGSRLLKIDLDRRSVSQALEADDILSVGRFFRPKVAGDVPADAMARPYVAYIVRRPDRVSVFEPWGESVIDVVLPPELRHTDFALYSLADGTALADVFDISRRRREIEHELIWFDSKGTVTRREKVSFEWWWYQPRREEAFIGALAVPAPVTVPMVGLLLSFEEPTTLAELTSSLWPGALLTLLVAVVVTVAADRWRARYGLPRSYAWLAFVFLLGLPGLAGYLLHRRWPVRHPVAAPARTGAEVFA